MTERKNSDLVPQEEEAVAAEPAKNKALDFLKFEHMTMFVDLPSEGRVYPPDSALSTGTVEISLMLAPHEEILSNETYLRNGVLFEKLIDSLLVDKSISSGDLIAGDKTAILIAARRDAYGPDYNVKFLCASCGTAYDDVINLDDDIVCVNGVEEPGVTREGLTVTIDKLPKAGVSLKFNFLTGKEDKELFDYNKALKKNGGDGVTTSDQYRLMFKEINGIEDAGTINQFINIMRAGDSKYIKSVYKRQSPDIKLMKESTCKHCKKEETKEAVFNTEFFWPSDE